MATLKPPANDLKNLSFHFLTSPFLLKFEISFVGDDTKEVDVKKNAKLNLL